MVHMWLTLCSALERIHCRQYTTFTCTTACIQYLLRSEGIYVSQKEIAEETDAIPDGTLTKDAVDYLEKYFKVKECSLNLKTFKRYIDKGKWILTDRESKRGPHSIVVTDYYEDQLEVWDPKYGFTYWTTSAELFSEATEAHAVGGQV